MPLHATDPTYLLAKLAMPVCALTWPFAPRRAPRTAVRGGVDALLHDLLAVWSPPAPLGRAEHAALDVGGGRGRHACMRR